METFVVALFAFVLGALFLFWGYRVFLVMLPIWGFFAGFWVGAQTVGLIFGGGFLATTTGWIVGFLLGLVFAVLSYLFYMFGVALVAGAIGYALVTGFFALFGMETGFFIFVMGLIGGLITAVLTIVLNLQKYVIMVLTSIGGANAVILAVLLLLGRVTVGDLEGAGNSIRPILQDSWFWGLVWLALAVAGLVFQLRMNRSFWFGKKVYIEGGY
ncbi:MAG: DUF4203 domain-containing protein [Candidatus Promineifilaceae bacterium]|nr:DUF4203 domain-containing protein [Candidatus Promineifilaceae bacterium]